MKKDMDINIDALLRDTFLTVVELRQGTTVRHGIELYRHCQRQVELVRERLKDAGFSRENVEHITSRSAPCWTKRCSAVVAWTTVRPSG